MFPRFPLFKVLSLFLWLVSSLGIFYLWFQWTPFPRAYYLLPSSGFLYERLLLPRLPALPGSTPKTERYTVLMWRCPGGLCLVTPESEAAHKGRSEMTLPVPGTYLRKMIDEQVYGGSLLGSMIVPLVLAPILLVTLFGVGVYLDARRRRLMLGGIQLEGRRPVTARRFSGWRRQDDFVIQIEGNDGTEHSSASL